VFLQNAEIRHVSSVPPDCACQKQRSGSHSVQQPVSPKGIRQDAKKSTLDNCPRQWGRCRNRMFHGFEAPQLATR
ncbi:hypothetical protein, partial [Mesorhizobium sp. M7A.F.Ca.CA.002.10.1.1]|uniref:hypothetical protein n=1 Tax=Mesorhizobium sp. M7A.F.Ca.CA.002.10.1.1 TaxID=2496685 RepID=UPI0019D1D0BB